MRTTTAALAVMCLPLANAAANDSPASVPAGGLRLERSTKVSMVSEDLDISPDLVKVRYVFRNVGEAPERLHVAFPLPPMPAESESPSRDGALPGPNYLGFRVSVDGREISPALEVKGFLKGKDVTDGLRRANALPGDKGTEDRKRDDELLTRHGLVVDDRDMWDVAATFHWDKEFPPGRDVTVEHTYRPVAGVRDSTYEPYCTDAPSIRAIEAINRLGRDGFKDGSYAHYFSYVVDYVLLTARNWSGPIGTFHLTIRKPSPHSIVSTCLEGLEKTSPTTFEMTRRDFVPDRDIKVLFVMHPETGRELP